MKHNSDQIGKHWPVFRTSRQVQPGAIWRASLFGAAGSFLTPLLIGVLLSALAIPFETVPPSGFSETISVLGFFLAMSAIFSLVAIVPALFLAVAALKAGFAGWGVATGAGAVVAIAIFTFVMSIKVNPVIFWGTSGALFGGLFWLCARLSTPQAFVKPADQL
jgi:hypothetical protein